MQQKLHFLLLLIFILFFSNIGRCQKKNYQVANIAFYNLENFFDTTHDEGKNDYDFLPNGSKANTSDHYLKKVSNMASVIKDIGTNISPEGATVIGVAEVENGNVLNDLVHNPLLKERNYQIVHYESPDARGIDVGFLYNPKNFKLDTSFPITVHLPEGSHNGHSATRDILLVAGKLDGEQFYFFVNHWPSRLGGQAASEPDRDLAASIARKHIDSIFKINAKANIVIMGDLNDNPDSHSIVKVLNANDNTNTSDASLYNPFLTLYKKGIGTLAYQDAWALFDQIMISRNLLNKSNVGQFFLYKPNIFKRDDIIQSTGRYKGYPKRTYDFDRFADGFSDHFPTFITLLKEIQ